MWKKLGRYIRGEDLKRNRQRFSPVKYGFSP